MTPHQCRFTDVTIQHPDGRGDGGGGCAGGWAVATRGSPAPSSQCCREPETALKNEVPMKQTLVTFISKFYSASFCCVVYFRGNFTNYTLFPPFSNEETK